jgi:thiol-disulfide isomerase/thioredoxin
LNRRTSELTRAASLVLAAFATAFCSQSGDAGAQTSGSSLPLQENLPRSWYRNYDYRIEVDGRVSSDAGLYLMVGKPYMLIYGSSLDNAFVLSTNEPKVVRPVKKDQITTKSDLEVVLPESSFTAATPIPWMQDGPTAAIFYAGQRRFRIGRLDPIVGPTTYQDIVNYSPVWKIGMDQYTPDANDVAWLRSYREKVTIEVWFGSWCPHCQQVLPMFFKALQAAANPNIEVTYYGVPREFGNYTPAVQKDVKGLPTLIFLKGGRELGRIRGGPEKGPFEAEVVRILKTPGVAQGG